MPLTSSDTGASPGRVDCWLLIVGGGRSSVGLIDSAMRQGYRTLVFDRAAEAPGAKRATRTVALGREDGSSIAAFAHAFTRSERVVGVTSASTAPAALRTVALLRQVLALPGPDQPTTERVLERTSWKCAVEQVGIRTPVSLETDRLDAVHEFLALHPRAFLKPGRDGRGGHGVIRIASSPRGTPGRIAVSHAFQRASRSSAGGHVVVEEAIEGDEYSVDLAAHRGHATLLRIARKHTKWFAGRPLPIGYSWGPARPGARADDVSEWSGLHDIGRRVARALRLDATLFTLDVLLSKTSREAALIDVGFLLDAKVDLGLSFSGVDADAVAVQTALGQPTPEAPDAGAVRTGFATRFLFASRTGTLRPVLDGPRAPGWIPRRAKVQIEWEVPRAAPVGPPRSLADLVGWVQVDGPTAASAWRRAMAIPTADVFSVAPPTCASFGSTPR